MYRWTSCLPRPRLTASISESGEKTKQSGDDVMGKSGIRREKLRGVLLLSCTVLLCMRTLVVNAAEAWQPHARIAIVGPTGRGGGLDLVGRTLQSVIQKDKLGSKPVTVINRPGGGG